MQIIDKRATLMRLLEAEPGLTQRDIAHRMAVSERTARRHLASLHAAGDIVVELDGSAKRYRLSRRPRKRGRVRSENGVYRVRLEALIDAAPHFYMQRFHPTQRIEAELPNGSTIVSLDVTDLEAIASFVTSWGPAVRVLGPSELSERVCSE